jgi:MerR family transcriptional regulator, light-induced transcriptional regulator
VHARIKVQADAVVRFGPTAPFLGSVDMEDMTRGLELPTDRVSVGLSRFASDVVSHLLARGGVRPVVLDEALLESFMQAILSGDMEAVADLRDDFRRQHVTPGAVAELYIPEAARRFGTAWLNDTMTFCEVTLGSARLQSVLHDLATEFVDAPLDDITKGVVLVVVPAGEQHTLGGLTVACQLRRRGVSVCVEIGPTADAVRALVASRRFDGAFVSVGSSRQLEALPELVKAMKSNPNHSLMVAVGGAIADAERDRVARSGADLVTCDLDEALAILGVATARPRVGRF